MKKIIGSVLVVFLLASACQTAPKKPAETPAATKTETPAPAPASTAPTPAATPMVQPAVADVSSIKAGDTGFSPLAQAPHNYMAFSLHFGQPDLIQSWTIDFVSKDGTVVHEVKGSPPQLPPAVTWDGTADNGTPASEGVYLAKLSVDHGSTGVETAQTDSFLVDRTPASGTITVTPQPFNQADNANVTLTMNVTPGIAAVSSWRLFVVHPNGSVFMNFISEDHKDNIVSWNGRAVNNASMEAGTTYNLSAQIFDQYGNVGTLKTTLAVAQAVVPAQTETAKPEGQSAPVTVTLDGQVIAESQVFFPAYSADLGKVSQAKMEGNAKALDALAEALKAAPGSKIKVIGHANKVYWQDAAKGDREQQNTLIPLSLARAQAVRDALVERGLDSTLFDVDGVGADGNVAPFGDLVNNWKNRRVEFNVEK